MYDVGRAQPSEGGRVATAAVGYDAGSDSYTVHAGDETFVFTTAEIVIDASNVTRFEKTVNGVTTTFQLDWGHDTPWLTNTEFVKLGQVVSNHEDVPTGTESYEIVDLVFGVLSVAEDVPTTGSAAYKISLKGSRSSSVDDRLLLMMGSGEALVDFSSGRLDFRGRTADFMLDGSGGHYTDRGGELTGTARIAADTNAFAGTFEITTGASGTYTGDIDGSFYGLEANEIGGLFYGTNGSLYYSLAFAGFALPEVSANDTLDGLIGQTRLESVRRIAELPDPTPEFEEEPIGEHITYDADTQTYFVFDMLGNSGFGPANRTPSKDTADTVAYGAAERLANGKATYEINLFDGEADGIELTYASFLRVLETETDLEGSIVGKRAIYYVFGKATPPDQLPRTGTASYSGSLFGDVTDGTEILSPLVGTSSLDVDFARQSLTANLTPVATNLDGVAENFGTFSFSGLIDSFTATFDAALNGGSGSMAGRFFGSEAQEFGATFGIRLEDRDLNFEGVTVGRRDDR